MFPAWQIGGTEVAWGEIPWVMAVLNLTEDSFYAASRTPGGEAALPAAARALEDGARILDLGAESTRPGSTPVTPAAEWERLAPALHALRGEFPATPLSVDTRHASTARQALEAGADIINDVSGLEDPGMAAVLAGSRCGVVLMHHRGAFQSMSRLPPLADPAAAVTDGFEAMLAAARGLARERIVLDPGFGFGKNLDENYPLFGGLPRWLEFGRPLLVGVSRKSFLGHTLGGVPPEQRLAASLAAATAAVLAGAAVVRAHDVRPTVEALRVAARIRPYFMRK